MSVVDLGGGLNHVVEEFIEQLTEMAPRVPDQTEVLALRRLSVDEVHARRGDSCR